MSDVYLDSAAAGYRHRARRLMLVVLAVFSVYIGRLVQLQLIEGGELEAASERNFLRTVKLPADRGTIYDRGGKRLAHNEPRFDLYVTPARVDDVGKLMELLKPVLGLDSLDVVRLRDRIEEPRGMWRHRALRVSKDVGRAVVSRIEGLRAQVGGLTVKVEYQRLYPEAERGAHLVGYMGRVTAEELRKYRDRGYTPESMIGRFGLERRFESALAGEDGFERIVVNARGARAADQTALEELDEELRREPEPGHDLHLTIDTEVQKLLVRAMRNYDSGAAVVVDPVDGSIRGLVSKPSFDPNAWSGRLTAEAKKAIDENPFHPMLDKSVHAYFPGSVQKVVTALSALEAGILDPEARIESPGFYEFGNRLFRCHKRSGHGAIDLPTALAASADVYFYKIGEVLGTDTLAEANRRFGFGTRAGVLINGESKGLVPDRDWHDAHTPGGYQHGLALGAAIGQGEIRTTPIQLAMAYAALANGGTLYAPRLVDRITTRDGRLVSDFEPQVVRDLEIDPTHLAYIRDGLFRAVNDEERGTAGGAAFEGATLDGGAVAGKTGTAQVRSLEAGYARRDLKRFRHRDHAWFAGYAPADSPRLVVVVFLEHGGSGGKDAAPVAGEIIRGYHERIEAIFRTQAARDAAEADLRAIP